ncbi:MAG: DEAD/DEAH box helicase [Desulfobacteraceae bacterium]|nr:DEAD/DEAH box helicase [Desulfobacteraceae bacterium]
MQSFINMGVHEDIIQAIDTLGFVDPTPVQARVIPLMLDQQSDMVGLAQTGTGKTAAFGIPLIQQTDTSRKATQALILCPTRELCVQVAKDLMAYGKHHRGVKIVAVYGGAPIDRQIKAIRRGAQIIVATPGRMLDLMRRRKVDISEITSVVLDEADEILQMGFREELNAILDETPTTKRTLLFSATMPRSVSAIADKYMTDPEKVTIGRRNAGAENVNHVYYVVRARDRYPALKRLVDTNPGIYAIVFCQTRQQTREIAAGLIEDGYNTDALHGELSQHQRDAVMHKFRGKRLQLLIATDVAARGLDVNDLTHVIHYNLPEDPANYTHRSGRTGRAGKSGISLSLIHMREKYRINAIQKQMNTRFVQGRIPDGAEILETKVDAFVADLANINITEDHKNALLPMFMDRLASYDRLEVIERFVSMVFDRSMKEYLHSPDLNAPEPVKRPKSKKSKSPLATANNHFTLLTFNMGKKNGLHTRRLIGEINEIPGPPRIKIGKIEIKRNSTMVEVENRYAALVVDAFALRGIDGKPMVSPISHQQKPKRSSDKPRHQKSFGASRKRKKRI